MRGRIPDPNNVKQARGSKNGGKSLLPVPAGRPAPGALLSKEGRKVFRSLCDELESASILSPIDGPSINMLASLWADYAEIGRKIEENPDDLGLRRIKAGISAQILAYSREFGLTPLSRTRLSPIGENPAETDSIWDDLANEGESGLEETA